MSYSPFGLGIATLGTSQVSKFVSVDSNGDLIIPDSDKFKFGTGADASIYFDATNLVIADENIPVSIGHSSSTVTIAGNLTVNGTTTSVNQTYIDVTNAFVFEGATADNYETTLAIIDPTADATINLPAMGAGTYYLPVLAVASTTSITSTPAELNILDGVTATYAELNYVDIVTLGTAAASKALTWAADSTWTAAGGTCANLGTVTTVDINGGTIDGAVIGGAATAAGSFAALAGTTGTFSGILKTDDTTDATSTTDGSLQTDGGLSVAKDGIFGNDVKLLTDASVFAMGVGSDFTITHDGSTGATIATGATGLAINTDTITVSSANSTDPVMILKNTNTDANGARLRFVKDAGEAGADSDNIGVIEFYGDDTAQTQTVFAKIVAEVSESLDTDEAGKLSFYVAESDGTTTALAAGLVLEGEHATNGEVDVTIGAGTASTSTVAGNLTVTGDITLDDGGSLKEAGGTAALTFDGSGNITKIGVSTQTSGHFLKYDGSKWLAAAVTAGSLAADDLTVGDAAVTLSTSVGNITIETQATDTDIIFNVDDGDSQITALTLDGSDDGAAIFKSTIKGTVFKPAVEVISSANVTVSNGYTAISTAGSNRTATMPEATAALVGATYTIKKTDSGSGNVQVTAEGDGLIDGGATAVLYHQFESVTLICRAADVWDIM